MVRDLVAGEVLAAVRDQLLGGEVGIAPDHYDLHCLARSRIRQTDGADLQHARMQAHDLFNLVGEHLEARNDDQVLLAVDHANETVFVDDGDVARAQESVGHEYLRRLLRPLPVALHHLWPADAEFARLTRREIVASIVSDDYFGGWDRQADRAVVF